MPKENSYTTVEVAKLLKVSKLTVYDLIKKGELPAFRVGRQMRIDEKDLEAYKTRGKGEQKSISSEAKEEKYTFHSTLIRPIIISGQDNSLDILANHIEKQTKAFRPLRSYVGSLDSLLSMYKGEADIVSTHLLEGDTGEYNVPYICKILVNHRFLVINLVTRWAGFYVQKGNPKKIKTWIDLTKPGITMVNREIGSGARVLVDEQFRMNQIDPEQVQGYEKIETNHLSVAGVVSKSVADVGIGIEKASFMVDVDFIPLIKERYDLVLLKTPENKELIDLVVRILKSPTFQNELKSIKGHDISQTGQIIYESK